MKSLLNAIIIIIICIFYIGCAKQKTPLAVNKQKNEQVVIDKNFVTTIKKTKDPYVFEISIQKANKKAGTKISGLPAVVDLTLVDGKGKIFTADKWQDQKYAKEIGNTFSTLRKPGLQTVIGKVQLLKDNLPPGRYKVQPRIKDFHSMMRQSICIMRIYRYEACTI